MKRYCLLILFLCSACGGGGGGDDEDVPAAQPGPAAEPGATDGSGPSNSRNFAGVWDTQLSVSRDDGCVPVASVGGTSPVLRVNQNTEAVVIDNLNSNSNLTGPPVPDGEAIETRTTITGRCGDATLVLDMSALEGNQADVAMAVVDFCADLVPADCQLLLDGTAQRR